MAERVFTNNFGAKENSMHLFEKSIVLERMAITSVPDIHGPNKDVQESPLGPFQIRQLGWWEAWATWSAVVPIQIRPPHAWKLNVHHGGPLSPRPRPTARSKESEDRWLSLQNLVSFFPWLTAGESPSFPLTTRNPVLLPREAPGFPGSRTFWLLIPYMIFYIISGRVGWFHILNRYI